MNQLEYQRELLAFDEKTALAELEQSKAAERVHELKYQKTRFQLEFLVANLKAQQAQAEKQAQTQQPKPEEETVKK
jgi:hypothetical protein